jgi:hypothetical protein
VGDACDDCPDDADGTQADDDYDGHGDACQPVPEEGLRGGPAVCGPETETAWTLTLLAGVWVWRRRARSRPGRWRCG